MIRNLKVMGLLLGAMLAISAMGASAAQAQKGVFTGGDTVNGVITHTATTITGKQKDNEAAWNFFEAAGQEVTCKAEGVSFHGTDADGIATTLKLTPTYKDCTAAGLPATVTTNGCEYLFTQPETAADVPAGSYTGKADLTCPVGKVIDVEVFLFGTATGSHSTKVCTIEVYADEEKVGEHNIERLGGHVVYTNGTDAVTGKDDVTAKATIEGITYKKSGSCGAKEGHDAIYKNTVTVTGDKDPSTSEPADVTISEVE